MIAATFANSNYGGEEGAQQRIESIQGIVTHFNEAITLVYYPKPKEPEVDWSNPFYAAAKRNLEKTRAAIEGIDVKRPSLVESMDKEQLEARERGRKAIDQL